MKNLRVHFILLLIAACSLPAGELHAGTRMEKCRKVLAMIGKDLVLGPGSLVTDARGIAKESYIGVKQIFNATRLHFARPPKPTGPVVHHNRAASFSAADREALRAAVDWAQAEGLTALAATKRAIKENSPHAVPLILGMRNPQLAYLELGSRAYNLITPKEHLFTSWRYGTLLEYAILVKAPHEVVNELIISKERAYTDYVRRDPHLLRSAIEANTVSFGVVLEPQFTKADIKLLPGLLGVGWVPNPSQTHVILRKHPELDELLGAAILQGNHENLSPEFDETMGLALDYRREKVIEALLEKFNGRHGPDSLEKALTYGHMKAVRAFHKRGIQFGYGLLGTVVARSGNREVFDFFLEADDIIANYREYARLLKIAKPLAYDAKEEVRNGHHFLEAVVDSARGFCGTRPKYESYSVFLEYVLSKRREAQGR